MFFQVQLSFLSLIRKTADGGTPSTVVVLFKVMALHRAHAGATYPNPELLRSALLKYVYNETKSLYSLFILLYSKHKCKCNYWGFFLMSFGYYIVWLSPHPRLNIHSYRPQLLVYNNSSHAGKIDVMWKITLFICQIFQSVLSDDRPLPHSSFLLRTYFCSVYTWRPHTFQTWRVSNY